MKLIKTGSGPRWLNTWHDVPAIFDDDFFEEFSSISGLNLWEDKDKVYVEVAVPGIEEKDVDVNLENGVLTVRAVKEKQEESENRGTKVYSSSIKTNFFYSTRLPGNINPKSVEAVLDNGVLNINIEKSEEAKPKKIEVKKKLR